MILDVQTQKTRKQQVLINVGRGSTICEEALAAALRARGSASESGCGFGLSFAGDVFKDEPLPADSGLWDLENCLISAHCMDWTVEAKAKTATAWVDNVERFSTGGAGALLGVVDPRLGY